MMIVQPRNRKIVRKLTREARLPMCPYVPTVVNYLRRPWWPPWRNQLGQFRLWSDLGVFVHREVEKKHFLQLPNTARCTVCVERYCAFTWSLNVTWATDNLSSIQLIRAKCCKCLPLPRIPFELSVECWRDSCLAFHELSIIFTPARSVDHAILLRHIQRHESAFLAELQTTTGTLDIDLSCSNCVVP
jgi:hypothetical protein